MVTDGNILLSKNFNPTKFVRLFKIINLTITINLKKNESQTTDNLTTLHTNISHEALGPTTDNLSILQTNKYITRNSGPATNNLM